MSEHEGFSLTLLLATLLIRGTLLHVVVSHDRPQALSMQLSSGFGIDEDAFATSSGHGGQWVGLRVRSAS